MNPYMVSSSFARPGFVDVSDGLPPYIRPVDGGHCLLAWMSIRSGCPKHPCGIVYLWVHQVFSRWVAPYCHLLSTCLRNLGTLTSLPTLPIFRGSGAEPQGQGPGLGQRAPGARGRVIHAGKAGVGNPWGRARSAPSLGPLARMFAVTRSEPPKAGSVHPWRQAPRPFAPACWQRLPLPC